MSFFKLSGLLQDFFARRQAWLVAGLLLAAGGFTANAQTSASNQRAVLLNVVAVDSAGNPVPDLKASEFAVFDNGSPRQIASVRLNQSDKPGPLVVLFDPLMDSAMQKVSQVKPVDFRAVSGISLQSRFTATYRALDDMRALMAALHGPKGLLWVTYGIPSTIHLADRTWFDGVPFLRQMGARFVQSETTVYTADPGISLQTGILNRDSLDILTGATGGRVFSRLI